MKVIFSPFKIKEINWSILHVNHPVIEKPEEMTLDEPIRRRRFPRDRKVLEEQSGAELETTEPHSTILISNINKQQWTRVG